MERTATSPDRPATPNPAAQRRGVDPQADSSKTVADSPSMALQRRQVVNLQNSPLATAQRRWIHSSFGGAAQLAASAQGEGPLQGRVQPTMHAMGAQALGPAQKVGANDEAPIQGRADLLQLWAGGKGVVQRVLNGAAAAGRQAWVHGLVNGGYDRATNTADAHIAVGGPDGHLTKASMLAAVQDIYQAMQAAVAAGGPAGTVEMHPQGAVALKTVIELLGSALGGWWGAAQAAIKKLYREKTKTVTKSKLADELDAVIIPEHMAFIGAMIGVGGVNIQPIIPDGAPTTLAEFNQNMLANTSAGLARRNRYKAALEADTAVSLRVTVNQASLPAIIAALQ